MLMRTGSRGTGIGLVMGLLLAAAAARAEEAPPADPRSPTDFREVIRGAKAKVFPALVYVRCIRETREKGKRETEQVGGSGVLISEDGRFLTNWHVVDKAIEVRCLLQDGRALSARVLGTDKDTDLGLCQLEVPPEDGDLPFPWAAFGDSDALAEGDFVMAMGAPWGMARSVSLGILSCTRRYLPGHSEYSLWLQTDAAISPGNSGGPLVNTDGEIVGINTRGVMRGGDMGFAIPSSTIVQVVDPLRQYGCVRWTWTGLRLQPLRDFDKDMYFEGNEGVIVAGTDPDSPAREAGIVSNDRIRSLNGEVVTARVAEDLPALRRRLALLPAGETVNLTIVRGDAEIVVAVTPREKGQVEGEELDLPRWDVSVKEINRFDNPNLHFHRKEGVFVHGVKRPGNAASAGLRRGDILLKIGKAKITALADVKAAHAKALEGLAEENRILVTVLRNGLLRQLVLDFARDYERK